MEQGKSAHAGADTGGRWWACPGDIVARRIEGEIIIVPLTAGIGDLEDELYTLNPTGQAVWDLVDGVRSLGEIADELGRRFVAEPEAIAADVLGLVGELVRRKMLVVV